MFLSTNCSKGGTHVIAPGGRSFRVDFKCAWKGNGLKLLTPITFNKNEYKSNKNLEAMMGVTKAQLFKYVTEVMTFEEINITPPLKMGEPLVDELEGPQGTPMSSNPKVFQKLP